MTHTAEFSPTGLIREALSSRSDQALSALESRTAHSWMMAMDRAKVLPEPTGAASPAVRLFVKASAGARVTDVDGTSFIDLGLGDGALILGHAHAAVQQAIVAQSARGWNFDLPAESQLELARLIQTAGAANERVALCNTAGDAAAYAVHAARLYTGKPMVAGFTGAANLLDGDETATVLPYGHPAALDQIRRRRHEMAAVIVEPVRGIDPNLDRAAWLRGLIATCRECAVLVILDERQTGFRLAYGGAQELLGLLPDLVIYGKAVGGGLPLAAVAGRANIMAMPQENTHRKPDGLRRPAPNPLSVTAGTAALDYLLAHRSTLYPALNAAGRALAEQFNAFTAAERLPVEMRSAGSMFRIAFSTATAMPASATHEWSAMLKPAEAAFNVLVLNRGILMLPGQRGFLSTAHTADDRDETLRALTESLRDARDDGLFAHARA